MKINFRFEFGTTHNQYLYGNNHHFRSCKCMTQVSSIQELLYDNTLHELSPKDEFYYLFKLLQDNIKACKKHKKLTYENVFHLNVKIQISPNTRIPLLYILYPKSYLVDKVCYSSFYTDKIKYNRKFEKYPHMNII